MDYLVEQCCGYTTYMYSFIDRIWLKNFKLISISIDLVSYVVVRNKRNMHCARSNACVYSERCVHYVYTSVETWCLANALSCHC